MCLKGTLQRRTDWQALNQAAILIQLTDKYCFQTVRRCFVFQISEGWGDEEKESDGMSEGKKVTKLESCYWILCFIMCSVFIYTAAYLWFRKANMLLLKVPNDGRTFIISSSAECSFAASRSTDVCCNTVHSWNCNSRSTCFLWGFWPDVTYSAVNLSF